MTRSLVLLLSVVFVAVILAATSFVDGKRLFHGLFHDNKHDTNNHVAAAPNTNTNTNTPVYITTTSTLFDSLARKVILPALDGITKNITIPALHLTDGKIHIDTKGPLMIDLDTSNISFSFTSPSDLLLQLQSILFTTKEPVAFEIKDGTGILALTCDGHLQPTNDGNGSVLVDFPFVVNKTTNKENKTVDYLGIGDVTVPSLHLGKLNTNLVVTSLVCKIAIDAIEKLAHASINQIVVDLVKNITETKIVPLLGDALHSIVESLDLPLAAAPATASTDGGTTIDGLTLAFDLADLLNISGNISSQQRRSSSSLTSHTVGAQPYYVKDRDISVGLSSDSVTALLRDKLFGPKPLFLGNDPNLTTSWLRAFIPIAYERCPNCPLVFELIFAGTGNAADTFVTFQNNNATLATSNGIIKVLANRTMKNQQYALVELFSCVLDSSASAEKFHEFGPGYSKLFPHDSILHFELNLNEFQILNDKSNVGPLQPQVLGYLVKHVLNTLLFPLLNDILYIPLSTKIALGNLTITKPEVVVNEGVMVIGLNVLF